MIREGLPLVIVQPGLVYGPGDEGVSHDMFVQILARAVAGRPQGTAFCWGHVDDTARGHLLAMEAGTPGETYIFGGPRHTFTEGLAMMERLTVLPAPASHPRRRPAARGSRPAGPRWPGRAATRNYTGESLRVVAGATYTGSNAKARRDLGFTARALEAGLRETLAWEMSQLGCRCRAG